MIVGCGPSESDPAIGWTAGTEGFVMVPGSARKVFVNIAVENVDASIEFFAHLGFLPEERYRTDASMCLRVSDDTYLRVCDASTHPGTTISISAGTRAEVDNLVHRALMAGAKPANDRPDRGLHYGWNFYDLDQYLWELVWIT